MEPALLRRLELLIKISVWCKKFVFPPGREGGKEHSATALRPHRTAQPPPFIINEVFLGRVPPTEGGWPVLLIQMLPRCVVVYSCTQLSGSYISYFLIF